jgi:hypothetical protein
VIFTPEKSSEGIQGRWGNLPECPPAHQSL